MELTQVNGFLPQALKTPDAFSGVGVIVVGIETDIMDIRQALARLESRMRAKTGMTKSKRLPEKQARVRTAKILADVKKHGMLSVDKLGDIAARHGMARTATGALYAGGYLKKDTKGKVSLTQKGKDFKA